MAKFCRNCGRPLEDGFCPVCDAAPEPEGCDPGWIPEQSVGGRDLLDPILSVFSSGDITAILTVAGFGLMAVSSLLWFFHTLGAYGLRGVSYWLSLISMLLTGAYLVRYFRTPDKSPRETMLASSVLFFAVFGVIFLLGFILGLSLVPAIFLFVGLTSALFFQWQLPGNGLWSRICLIVLAVTVFGLLLNYLHAGMYVLYLSFFPASLCCAEAYARNMAYGQ